MGEKLRLDKFLSGQLNISRADAKELIKKRLVSVNGETAKLYDMKIDTAADSVCSEGVQLTYREHVYIEVKRVEFVSLFLSLDKTSGFKTPDFTNRLTRAPHSHRKRGIFIFGHLSSSVSNRTAYAISDVFADTTGPVEA